jgi:CBS domain-containing protein
MRAIVGDVMSTEPITIRPDTPFKEIVDVLIRHGIGGVPVTSSDGRLLGVVTEGDLLTKPAFSTRTRRARTKLQTWFGLGRDARRKATGLTAREIMTAQVVTAAPYEYLDDVALRLVEHRIGRLPVVDDGRLVGIVTRKDALRPFDRSDDDIAADVQAALDDRVTFEYGHDARFSVKEGVVELTGTVPAPDYVNALADTVAHVSGVVHVDNSLT